MQPRLDAPQPGLDAAQPMVEDLNPEVEVVNPAPEGLPPKLEMKRLGREWMLPWELGLSRKRSGILSKVERAVPRALAMVCGLRRHLL
jgi:hypothetical protein